MLPYKKILFVVQYAKPDHSFDWSANITWNGVHGRYPMVFTPIVDSLHHKTGLYIIEVLMVDGSNVLNVALEIFQHINSVSKDSLDTELSSKLQKNFG